MTQTRGPSEAKEAADVATPKDGHLADVPAWDLTWDIVDQWGAQSFPASDPPANW